MKTLTISGSPRVSEGTKGAQGLRAKGHVPCVIYGGKEQVLFSAEERQFTKLVYTPEVHLVKLDVGGRQFEAIMGEIQFHKVNDKILHIDFVEVIPGKDVVMDIPVKLEGAAAGVKAGGKLIKKQRTVKVKGPVNKIPDNITLNVEPLNIGSAIKIGDVKIDGLQLLDKPQNTIVSVQITRNVVEEPKAAAATPAAGAAAAATPAAGAAAAKAGAPAAAAKKPDAKK
ncbi:MAG: 50S ribosomal protein L25 [Bacteroidetes bacterium]|nr:50S ribosomal protein L25 [Bacteroidota bacterium]